jgi:hypothetical protein
VKHKVTESGRVSMTAEFLLRLLRASDGFDETDFEKFFEPTKEALSSERLRSRDTWSGGTAAFGSPRSVVVCSRTAKRSP